MDTIPILDMESAGYHGLSPEAKRSHIGITIYEALKGIGCVYLQNHGILRHATVQSALDFFALPLEVKMKYHRFVRTGCNGYTPVKEEQLTHSEDASLDIAELKETWDVKTLGEDMPEEEAPDFSRNIQEMMTACDRVSLKVMAALEVAMGRPGELTESHLHQTGPENSAVMRAFHYPPVPEHVPAGSLRLAAHSAWGSLTLLLDEAGGLEVLSRAGLWVPVPPVSGAVLVMAGDLLEIFTGGKILATKHRVRLPEDERQRQASQLSLGFFGIFDDGTTVAPPADSSGSYPTVEPGEYIKAKYRATMPNAALKV